MDKYNLNDKEWKILNFSPFDIAFGVAGSDGHIAREELAPLMNFITQSSFLKDELSRDIFGNIYDQGETLWKEHNQYTKKASLQKNLKNVGSILKKLDTAIAEPFVENLCRLGMGTGFSFGNPNQPLSNEEINQLGHMFRWMGYDISSYLEKINSTSNENKTEKKSTTQDEDKIGF
tara:strand:- start:56 stop:583 length:528 start_codon:yes stop_codon:yes gene_type:complete